MNTAADVRVALKQQANPEKAVLLGKYFKTGEGEYGAGDTFIGVIVPTLHIIARQFRHLPLEEITDLLTSPIHEDRLTALFIMVDQYEHAKTQQEKQALFDTYLAHTKTINNWDLIDSSAPEIVGGHLYGNSTELLTTLAHSSSLWERRIAVLATFYYISKGNGEETLRIAEILLHDTHDLIHKAVGWALREVGQKCSLTLEEAFLEKHRLTMPRTMLRYAIEKFTPERRQYFMQK